MDLFIFGKSRFLVYHWPQKKLEILVSTVNVYLMPCFIFIQMSPLIYDRYNWDNTLSLPHLYLFSSTILSHILLATLQLLFQKWRHELGAEPKEGWTTSQTGSDLLFVLPWATFQTRKCNRFEAEALDYNVGQLYVFKSMLLDIGLP